MAQILRGGSIYLHIPKTGGNWLTQLLEDHRLITGDIGQKHATYDVVCGLLQSRRGLRLRRLFTLGLTKYRFLAVVRHPLRWYESWFKYQVSKEFRHWGQSGDPIAWHVMSSINGVEDRECNAFVRSIHRRDPGFVTKLYAKYVANADAIVLRNEHLRDDLVAAGERLQLGIPPRRYARRRSSASARGWRSSGSARATRKPSGWRPPRSPSSVTPRRAW